MAAFENLSDAELRQQLKSFGEIPGPITGTTREVYYKKLCKLKGIEVCFDLFLTLFLQSMYVY